MKQTRFIPIDTCGLQVREPQEEGQESRVIEGTPIVFGVRSVNLTPWSDAREVYEVLEPGCITNDLLQRSDVVLNLNHSNLVPDVLGRCRNGKGTLELRLADDHVGCRCELPHTNNANDTLELMKRGDITGMSFAFEDDLEDSENGVSYERIGENNGKEVWLRHVKRITGLYDVAIVTHPAYEQTSVGTRELGERIDAAIDAQIKRDATTEKSEEERMQKEQQEAEERLAREQREAEEREAQERERVAKQHLMYQRAQLQKQDTLKILFI